MNMILLNSIMVILLCANGFLAGSLVTAFILRSAFTKFYAKEITAREKKIRMQKALIKQMQEEGKVKVEVSQASSDFEFPKE